MGKRRRKRQPAAPQPSVSEILYGEEPLERLLADLDTLARGLVGPDVLRVITPHREALTAIPAYCAAHGYTALVTGNMDWAGGSFYRSGYVFEITRLPDAQPPA